MPLVFSADFNLQMHNVVCAPPLDCIKHLCERNTIGSTQENLWWAYRMGCSSGICKHDVSYCHELMTFPKPLKRYCLEA